MRATSALVLGLSLVGSALGAPSKLAERDGEGEFENGQPISGDGKGAPILGTLPE